MVEITTSIRASVFPASVPSRSATHCFDSIDHRKRWLATGFDRKPENQQVSRMKATFDLPPDLVRAVKLRAVREGRKLKDVAAELLKRGLADQGAMGKSPVSKPRIEIQADGLPVVRCAADAPASRMTAGELLALEQEAIQLEDLQRLGHAL